MGEVSVTIVDIVIAVVILLSAGYAAVRGLMRETLSIFAWAAAAYAALRFFPEFRPVLRGTISPEWLADATSFVGIFILVLVPLSYMSVRFSDIVHRSDVGPVDRSLGFVFGVGRGLVIVGFAYIVFSIFVPQRDHPEWLTQARLLPMVETTSDVLLSLVPPPEDIPLDEIVTIPGARNDEERPDQRAENPPPEDDGATYGADERAALDRLIESTGGP